MKNYLISLGLGLLGVVSTVSFVLLAGENILMTFLFAILINALGAYFLAKKGYNYISVFVFSFPLCIFFYLILSELEAVKPLILLFLLVCFGGFLLSSSKTTMKIVAVVLVAISVGVAYLVTPRLIFKSYAEYLNEQAPSYSFRLVSDDRIITSDPTNNDIIILDFFATWCKPCIEELPELKELKIWSQENNIDLKIYVVSGSESGDNPEKLKSFIKKHNVENLDIGFDEKGNLRKTFGFNAIPGLVVIDKNEKIRLRHSGYNASEKLAEQLMIFLKQIESER